MEHCCGLTWGRSDLDLAEQGDGSQLERFKGMQVYEHASRKDAEGGSAVEQVRISSILVAQELGYGQRLGRSACPRWRCFPARSCSEELKFLLLGSKCILFDVERGMHAPTFPPHILSRGWQPHVLAQEGGWLHRRP